MATTEYAIGDAVHVRGDAVPGLPGAGKPGRVGRIQELHAYAAEDGGPIAGVRTAVDLVAVAVVDVEPARDLSPRERAELDYLDGLFPHLAQAGCRGPAMDQEGNTLVSLVILTAACESRGLRQRNHLCGSTAFGRSHKLARLWHR